VSYSEEVANPIVLRFVVKILVIHRGFLLDANTLPWDHGSRYYRMILILNLSEMVCNYSYCIACLPMSHLAVRAFFPV